MSRRDLEDIIAECGDITSVERDRTVARVVAFVVAWLDAFADENTAALVKLTWAEEMS
jgi:hypothetical protein